MILMLRRRLHVRFAVFLSVLGLSTALLPAAAQDSSDRGRKYKAPPPTARIQVTVLRDSDGKPLENVAVIFHPIEGERDKGGMEIKTNEDGKALIDVIPIGDTIRMQIFASGYQTYGEDYKVDKADILKEIRMKRPGAQYSTYKNNPAASQENSQTPPAPTAPAAGASGDGQNAAKPPSN
jgi:5-hydroxyisourate hydrolase-like protein (transthyretin family)